MGRIKISDLEKEQIINFLRSYDLKISTEIIRNMMLVNVGCLLFSVLISSNKSIYSMCVLGICMVIIGTYVRFVKVGIFSKEKIYLHHGGYACMFGVSMGLLGYQLLKKTLGNVDVGWYVLYIVMFIVGAGLTSYKHMRKLFEKTYDTKKMNMVGIIVVGPIIGVVISRVLRSYNIDLIFLYGILLVLSGIVFSGLSYFFVLSYCYSLVDENEVDMEETKDKQTRHMYTEYGKKRNDKLF